MPIRRGDTVIFPHPPVLAAWAAVGGKKESEGPLAQGFDELVQDAGFDAEGCTGWEQAESMLQQRCARHCLRKAGITKQQVELAFAGDLQAQCTASNYTMRQLGVPFAGLYGACSTMAEALCLAALCAAAGYAHEILAMSSSHFCAAERQFRTPLEYGGKRTPTAQWTATAAGACLVRGSGAAGVPVLSATIGRVCDAGVKDINNMGAAMAPAAAQTLLHYFADTGTTQQDFDAIGALQHISVGSLCSGIAARFEIKTCASTFHRDGTQRKTIGLSILFPVPNRIRGRICHFHQIVVRHQESVFFPDFIVVC